jgi:hypothetical protein
MLLAWCGWHAVMLALARCVSASDSRHSLPADPASDPTPVELMAGGANRVCLRPGRPEADSWLAGPQCFEDVKERLGLEDDVNFVAVLKAEAFGIPAAVGAAAEAPPIAIAQSESRPESKYIMHSSAAELMTYGLHYFLVCERNDGAGEVTLIDDQAHEKMLAAQFFTAYPSGKNVGCFTGKNHKNPEQRRMKMALTDVGFAFSLSAEHGGLGLYDKLQAATVETAVKKLPGSEHSGLLRGCCEEKAPVLRGQCAARHQHR